MHRRGFKENCKERLKGNFSPSSCMEEILPESAFGCEVGLT